MSCVPSSGAVEDDTATMTANDDWADISETSSVAACRSIDSNALYIVRSDSQSAYDNRQPDSGAREVATNAREVATNPERERRVDPHVQAGNGNRLFKTTRLGSLIEKHHFDRNNQMLPIHESYSSDGQYESKSQTSIVSQSVNPSNHATDDSLEGYGSDNSDTASLMAVANNIWGAANHFLNRDAAITSSSNVTPMENTSPHGSVVHSGETDTVSLEKMGTQTNPTEDAGTYKSASMLTGTTENSPPHVEGSDRSVIQDFSSPIPVSTVPNSKSTVKTLLEVEQPDRCIDDHETAEFGITMLPNKNDVEEDAQEECHAPARKAAKGKGFFGVFRRARENFVSNDMNTSTEVARPKHEVVGSLLVDDGPAEDEPTRMSIKNDDFKDVQENNHSHARKTAKGKNALGLRRTRSKGRKNVDADETTDKYSSVAVENFTSTDRNTSAEVARPKHQVVRSLFDDDGPAEGEPTMISIKNDDFKGVQEKNHSHARKTAEGKSALGLRRSRSKSRKNVYADEAANRYSAVVAESGDGQKSKSTTNWRFRRQSSVGNFVECDTVVIRNTHKKEIEEAEAIPRKMKSPRGRSHRPGLDRFTRMLSRSGSLGKKSLKNDASEEKMCAEGSVDTPLTFDNLLGPQKVFRPKPRRNCFDICFRCVNEMIVDPLLVCEDDISVVTPDFSIGASTWSDANSGTGATLSSWRSEETGTVKSIHAIAEDSELEAKVRKGRFLLFCKTLCKDLKRTDPAMYARVKAVIQDCVNQKKLRVPGFDFESNMRKRLLQTVGESNWRRIERDLDKRMHISPDGLAA